MKHFKLCLVAVIVGVIFTAGYAIAGTLDEVKAKILDEMKELKYLLR